MVFGISRMLTLPILGIEPGFLDRRLALPDEGLPNVLARLANFVLLARSGRSTP